MRLLWNCALIVAGTLYLILVLFHGIESPLFALAFVTLAGREVVHTHREKRQ
jgi:hypothetical protein